MRREKVLQIAFAFVAIMVLASGCGSSGPGKVSGKLVDPDTRRAVAGVPVWLMLVEEEPVEGGPFVMVDENRAVPVTDPGIQTETDATGEFTLEEVPVGEYVLMGGGPYVLKDEAGEAVVFELSSGEELDVGQVSFQP
ncbi:MAG: hypothetical protein GTO18_11060 [Anaerolineales bacterium]|nr:hypothetical protein [Anaerolineales bacterium]